MGVKGLWSFMKWQPALINKKYILHDMKLVIDANNLYYFIHLNNGIPIGYGGDYHLFADKVKDFFEPLKKCGISPYLVFHGGQESDTKLEMRLRKASQRIIDAENIAKGIYRKVSPVLGLETFMFILVEIGIPFVVGDFEVDKQIASLANEWNCPVLSNDSDYFIFSLEGGFVLLDKLDLTINTTKNEQTGQMVSFIYCNFYHFRNFVRVFRGLDMNLLPLLNSVCSNDYVTNHSLFVNFLDNLHPAPKDFGMGIVGRKNNAKFLSLLYWLKNQSSVSEAIGIITGFVEQEERERASKIMQDSVNHYKKTESSFCMKDFFEKNLLEFSENGAKRLYKKNPLPDWFLKSFIKGNVPVFCLATLNRQPQLLYVQVENLDCESSHACSRHIRQVIYGILFLHNMDKLSALKQSVEEYDRDGMEFQRREVKPILELDNFGPLPALNDISTTSPDILKQVFLSALGVSTQFLETFPTELKLVAATIVYWVKNSSPEIRKLMVSCLVAGILYLWAKIFRQYSPQQMAAMQESETNPSSLVKLMLDCEKKDFDLVGKNLVKMCGIPSRDYRKKKIDIAIVHSFNQFQSCLRYAVYLNSLLLNPFVATSPHLIFCGTFLYNIFHDAHQQPNPQEHIADAFGADSVLRKLFVRMDETFHSLFEPCYQLKEQSKKQKKTRGQTAHGTADDTVEFENKFKTLAMSKSP